MPFWLMKSEPDELSIHELQRLGRTRWDGVRNYQARNFMRSMQPGDLFFFYHSSCPEPGIAGRQPGVCRPQRARSSQPLFRRQGQRRKEPLERTRCRLRRGVRTGDTTGRAKGAKRPAGAPAGAERQPSVGYARQWCTMGCDPCYPLKWRCAI